MVTPELLFLDEPTTGLDPRSRNQVWDIIRMLVRNGTTVLLTTQYLEEADQLADRIAVIDHGRVIAEGPSAELKASVGSGVLHVRLAEAGDGERAAAILAARYGDGVQRDGDPRRLSVQLADPGAARRRPRRPRRRRHRARRILARPAQPRRGVLRPHRASGRGDATEADAADGSGGSGMSDTSDRLVDRRGPRPRACAGAAAGAAGRASPTC